MILPYFDMTARVTVGELIFNEVNSIRIYESVAELGNTAEVIIPRQYQKIKGKAVLDYIKAGDAVKIMLGYNGELHEEFTGFLTPPSADTPLVLRFDDEFWPLKQNNWVKSYKTVTLQKLLKDIVTGFKIDCPSIELGKFEIDNASTFHVLKKLQQDYGLFSRIVGGTLIVGYSWDWNFNKTNRFKYHLNKNVRGTRLQWKTETDFNVRVQVHILNKNGKKKTVKHGSDLDHASVVNIDMTGLTEAEAKNVAKARYNKYVFNGFTGTVAGFGYPRTHAGDSIEWQEDNEPERQGAYLVERALISYDADGYNRENTLAYKID